jgi:hypothetical protein
MQPAGKYTATLSFAVAGRWVGGGWFVFLFPCRVLLDGPFDFSKQREKATDKEKDMIILASCP